jgi:hypothetical protein
MTTAKSIRESWIILQIDGTMSAKDKTRDRVLGNETFTTEKYVNNNNGLTFIVVGFFVVKMMERYVGY